MAANTFKDVLAWQKAYDYCLYVYKITQNFPDFEKYALRSQFTRAAVSIPANIAEGFKKIGRADKLRFFNTAQGSLEECRCYNLLSKDLQYISSEQYEELESKINNASSFLNSYCKAVIQNSGVEDL